MNQQHIWEKGDQPYRALDSCKLCGVRRHNSLEETCWGLQIQEMPSCVSIQPMLESVNETIIQVELAYGGVAAVKRKVLAATYNNMIRAKIDPRKKKKKEFAHEWHTVNYDNGMSLVECVHCTDTKQDIEDHGGCLTHCFARERKESK